MAEKSMEKIVSLCKNRGYIYPGSEIYGGLSNSWDYGPLGAEMKKNINTTELLQICNNSAILLTFCNFFDKVNKSKNKLGGK